VGHYIARQRQYNKNNSFFDELAAILDRIPSSRSRYTSLVTSKSDSIALMTTTLISCTWWSTPMHWNCTGPTYQLGGTLHVVTSHGTISRPDKVDVEDVGLSDHFLLKWEVVQFDLRLSCPVASMKLPQR